jgi:plastocyanin
MQSPRNALLVVLISLAMFAAACSGNSSSPSTPTPTPPAGPSTAVSIPQGASTLTLTAFNPNPVNIAIGTTVRWTNSDAVAHTSTSDSNTWNSGTLGAGAHFDFTFQAAGTFPYHCAIHPGMVGTIVVR